MKTMLSRTIWELRHLRRSGQARWVCGSLLVAGLLAVWLGGLRLDAHRAETAALAGHYSTQMENIAARFSPQGEAGYVAYYTFYPTHHPLHPLGALTTGVRDLVPDVIWVRLLGLEGQLYEADLGNPLLQALGGFDLAFVWCALAPLALLVLAHDAVSREREHGRLPLLAAQSGSLAALALVRLGVRFAAVGLTATAAFLVGMVWLRIPLDAAALGWLGAAWAHLVCWAGLTALVIAFTRSVAGSLAAALTAWVLAVVLVPALLNLALVTAFPVREGLELTVRQRQESHAAWDKPRAETMEQFFAHHPDWSGTPPVAGRFAWRWYYAMQEMGDQSVSAESRAYRENLQARQAALTRVAALAPAAYAQLALSARAGTDLDAHLAYLEQVRDFHGGLKQHFYPLFFREATVTPADYVAFPRFEPTRPTPVSLPPLWPMLGAGLLAATAATLTLRRTRL